MQTYKSRKEQHQKDHALISKRHNLVGSARLIIALLFIYCLYQLLKSGNPILLLGLIILIGLFLYLVNIHQAISWKRKIKQSLVQVNEEEIQYLNSTSIPFYDGDRYKDTTHAYSFDLDIFGPQSFYHHTNRSETYIGQHKLANRLLALLPNSKIIAIQEAIRELANFVDWRQNIQALAKLTNDDQITYDRLLKWAKTPIDVLSKFTVISSYISPLIVIISFGIFLITQNTTWGYISLAFFVFNLILLLLHLKSILAENFSSNNINQIIKSYGQIISKIEDQNFNSAHMVDLQKRLLHHENKTSKILQRLSSIFANLDNFNNVIGAVFSNGIYLNHLHSFRSLIKWKSRHAENIDDWLAVIGEVESLNSFANMAFNNPDFNYPTLNQDTQINFKDLGHPLIKKQNRINNDVSFNDHNYIILTGSNMSGKSTFLRTLGLNMVLAGTGAPICAAKANIHPLPVLVSMRLTDSLQENESYFFAEVKRLKEIIVAAEHKISFILLDEILRGTNSDDKRSGTIKFVKNIIEKQALGVIATHDLEVCLTADSFPDKLTNKCFEVDIIDDDLSFDYKLRSGMCQNQSATFLMKKMGIID